MFSDNIGGLDGSEDELVYLANNIYIEGNKFGMEINPTKTKVMINDNIYHPRITTYRMNKLKLSTTSNIDN